MSEVIGWDIGGAHLKAARCRDGELIAVQQLPAPLWQDLRYLDQAVSEILRGAARTAQHLITMTGELADCFPDRQTGVRQLVERMTERLGAEIQIYAGAEGLLPPDRAIERWSSVASANWHASTAFVAARQPSGILIDIGSTTTDLIPFADGQVATGSRTDNDRLQHDELIYSGVVRTPVHAVADRVAFRGRWQRLAAELFATQADVYRLLDWLPDQADQMPTADGRGKAQAESRARLARMLGCDADEASDQDWRRVAADIARRQQRSIEDALAVIESRDGLPERYPLVGAGVGRFLARRLAAQSDRRYIDFGELAGIPAALADAAADCAPAVALALSG